MLDLFEDRAVGIAPVTLHVGYGTFLPIEAERVEDHVMEEEHFTIDEETARQVNGAKRVIAVGTTSTRVLESVADDEGKIRPVSGSTRLYLYPGIPFPAGRCAADELPPPEIVPVSFGVRLCRPGTDAGGLPDSPSRTGSVSTVTGIAC